MHDARISLDRGDSIDVCIDSQEIEVFVWLTHDGQLRVTTYKEDKDDIQIVYQNGELLGIYSQTGKTIKVT